MPVAPEQTIDAIMAYVKDDLRSKCRFWPRKIRELVGWDACQFFILVMLDQMQRVERASAAAKDFIDKRDKRWTPRTFWRNVAQMKLWDVKRYCTFSDKNEHAYNGKYASYNANKFSGWLRKNARIITERYEVVENIWLKDLPDEPSKKIDELTRRFAAFHGIGNNLANMAVLFLCAIMVMWEARAAKNFYGLNSMSMLNESWKKPCFSARNGKEIHSVMLIN